MNDLPDGELEVARDDARFLVVAGGVAGQLEDLGGEVLHHRSHVDGGASAHSLGKGDSNRCTREIQMQSNSRLTNLRQPL